CGIGLGNSEAHGRLAYDLVPEVGDGTDASLTFALGVERRRSDRVLDHAVFGEEGQPPLPIAALDCCHRPHRHLTRRMRWVAIHTFHGDLRRRRRQKRRYRSRLRKKPWPLASLVQVTPASALSQTVDPWRVRCP